MTVWLLPAQDSQSSDIRLFRVPDPRTRAPMTVAANASTGALYELQKAEDDLGSWFVGDSVKSDGSAFLLTDLDPLFILVGLLRARSDGDRFISLSDILNPDDQDAENLHHLEDLAGLGTKLTAVCDHRDVPGYGKVYRLNKQKTMAWLEAKVNSLLRAMEAVAGTSDKRALDSMEKINASRTRDALSIISAYLCEEYEKELTAMFREREPEETYTYADASDLAVNRRSAMEYAAASEAPKETKKAAPAKGKTTTQGVKALAKASTKGMNKLESFFTKK